MRDKYSIRFSEDSLAWQVHKEKDGSTIAIFQDEFYSESEAKEYVNQQERGRKDDDENNR